MAITCKNRNALRTERLIRDAFVSLLNQGLGDKVTVAAICREADINRSTFYAHYETLDDFKTHLLDEIGAMLAGLLDGILTESFAQDPEATLMPLGTYYQENLVLYRAVSNAYPSFSGMNVRERLLSHCGSPEPCDLLRFDVVLSSLLDVLHTWAFGAYGDMPVEELMARLACMYKAMLAA